MQCKVDALIFVANIDCFAYRHVRNANIDNLGPLFFVLVSSFFFDFFELQRALRVLSALCNSKKSKKKLNRDNLRQRALFSGIKSLQRALRALRN